MNAETPISESVAIFVELQEEGAVSRRRMEGEE